jgi:hypothetical protein
MKLPLHTTRWIARFMLGLLLFAQGVVAANACNAADGNVTQAFAVSQADEPAMHCHEEDVPNANACFVHCTQGDQVSVDQVAPVFVAPGVVTLVVDVPAPASAASTYFTSRVALNTGPPVSIRFCSFQI